MFNVGVITLSIGFFSSFLKHGLIKKALRKKLLKFNFWNPRDFTENSNLDGKIYGGGPGIIIKTIPLYLSLCNAKEYYNNNCLTIYLSPQGEILSNTIIRKILLNKSIIFVCGRYNGIDQRLIDNYIDLELSIGDYILSCGEIASLVVIDSIIRHIPGVLNNKKSINCDSFYNKSCLLGYPNYSKPRIFQDISVPKVLLSGNHKNINTWRLKKSFQKTLLRKYYLLTNMLKNKKKRKKIKILIKKILKI